MDEVKIVYSGSLTPDAKTIRVFVLYKGLWHSVHSGTTDILKNVKLYLDLMESGAIPKLQEQGRESRDG